MGQKLKLLMVGGDPQALKPGPVQRRLMKLAESLGELHVVVPAAAHWQQLDSNVWVYGSGGSSRVSQWLSTVRLATKLARGHSCQVVTAQDPFELGLAAYIVSKVASAKLHLQDHSAFLGNALFPKISFRRWFQWHLGRFLVRRAARVRTVSARGQRGLLNAGVQAARVDVVPVAADVAALEPLASQRQYSQGVSSELVYVGRLELEKGVEVLVRAMRPEWRLVVVGSGSLEQPLRSLAAKLGVRATWAGHQRDISTFLAAADIAVVPSLAEGWGLAAIEAAASGLPVAMSDVGCAGELLLNGESALVVPPGDPSALAAAIDRLAADPSLRQMLGQAGARAASKLPSAELLVQAAANSYGAAL